MFFEVEDRVVVPLLEEETGAWEGAWEDCTWEGLDGVGVDMEVEVPEAVTVLPFSSMNTVSVTSMTSTATSRLCLWTGLATTESQSSSATALFELEEAG